jgi:hypothetical protein
MSTDLISFKEPRALAGLATKPPAMFLPNEKTAERFFGFFTANMRNKNTRRAYYKAACRFSQWCSGLFGTVRNPLAHAPKIVWLMPEHDALDILTLVSFVHRKLDGLPRFKRLQQSKEAENLRFFAYPREKV